MTEARWQCAFLSTENVREDIVDDHYAVAPLRKLGVTVQTVPWRDASVDWTTFDLVVVRSTWDYQDHLDEFFTVLEGIAASGTSLVNPLTVMRWNCRKTYLAQLQSAGVRIVDTEFGDALNGAGLDRLAQRFGDSSWIIKPDVGASASGVMRLHGMPDAATRADILRAFAATGYLAQPFIEDVVAAGEFSVFFFDGELSHCILKTPGDGDFRVQEEHGSHIRSIEPDDELLNAAQLVRAALPTDLLYERIDLVRDADGHFAVMEVELIEPSLYLRMHPAAGDNFAAAIGRRLART